MKKFGVMPQETILYGHLVPQNAIYGKIAFTYDRKIKIGERFITDKKGKMVFDKDGKPKIRNLYKTVLTKTGCVYSWEWFKTFTHKDHKESLEVWILYDNASKWQCVHLGDTHFTCMLQDFLLEKVKEWENNGYVFARPQKIVGQPKRRDVQKSYMHRGNPKSWALNPNYITDNIIIDPPHHKTNMDKLHPLNERPVYSSTIKSKSPEQYVKYTRTIIMTDEKGETTKRVIKIKDTVCNNPSNDGYIRNADGKVTTRDGKTIKTGF